jgi:hypothetical protein
MLANVSLKQKVLILSALVTLGLFFLGFIAYVQIQTYK